MKRNVISGSRMQREQRGPSSSGSHALQRWLRAVGPVVLAILLVFVVAGVAEACPTCKDGMSEAEAEGMIRGYFWSILFMMSMPFLIVGTLGSYFYWEVRRARKRQRLETFEVGAEPMAS